MYIIYIYIYSYLCISHIHLYMYIYVYQTKPVNSTVVKIFSKQIKAFLDLYGAIFSAVVQYREHV